MSRFSFRVRLFIALVIVSVTPLLFVAGVAAYTFAHRGTFDAGVVIQPVVDTKRHLEGLLAPASLDVEQRTAIRAHSDAIDTLAATASRAGLAGARWSRRSVGFLLVGALVSVLIVAVVGIRLSHQYAAPLQEIVDSTRRIQRREPLDAEPRPGTMPELAVLQRSLYQLQQELEHVRATEMESERLRTFGEVARRVAHEMKNPLTPIRLAVRQLARRGLPELHDELEVIEAESARLEAMARDFAELGRLPEGIASPVDLRELLEELLRNAVPDGIERELLCDQSGVTIVGYFDPLRRAFGNIIRNAVEACAGDGRIRVTVRDLRDRVTVSVADSGPGIPSERRDQIFAPYYTEKETGTGLGLAIVRQTVEQHHGSITVDDAPGGGARFTVSFPATS